METIHAADELWISWHTGEPVKDGAVIVGRDRVGAVGTLAEMRERAPDARVRRWPGALGPALVHAGPLPDAPTPRERIHAVLKLGAVAVLEEYVDTPELRAAAERNDVVVLGSAARRPAIIQTGRADLAVFGEDGACIATVCAGRLVHRRR
ncbi:hypothetical protein [Streptomyces sp. NBC_00996]|uniref:hypothetical protein n=1 Tax=Streptomyces sp. NBC_00996 TaxID=2903710 RepID=UPI003864345F|nr:hypothetical protein OG390_30385 [Streptomyces sp. NBC_00996]